MPDGSRCGGCAPLLSPDRLQYDRSGSFACRPPGGHSLRIRPEDFEAFLQRMFASAAQDHDATASSYLPEQVRPERGSHCAGRKANIAAARLPDGTPDVVALARRVSAANR